MTPSGKSLLLGNFPKTGEAVVRSSLDLGNIVRNHRKRLKLRQLDIAGLGNTGNRFVVELERGKPTVQLQKVLDVLDLVGLEIVVRPKGLKAP